jgi:bifunctional non-homologous end joining protein LigD
VFDLDPGPGTGLAECCRIALWLRNALADDGLQGVCKTSGGLGLHVYVPLAPGHSFRESKALARSLAVRLAGERADLVTAGREISSRAGRVLIDWIPNGSRSLTVTPYSLRAADLPSVSTPVGWDEVEAVASGNGEEGLTFSPRDVLERASVMGDLFHAVLELPQRLPG